MINNFKTNVIPFTFNQFSFELIQFLSPTNKYNNQGDFFFYLNSLLSTKQLVFINYPITNFVKNVDIDENSILIYSALANSIGNSIVFKSSILNKKLKLNLGKGYFICSQSIGKLFCKSLKISLGNRKLAISTHFDELIDYSVYNHLWRKSFSISSLLDDLEKIKKDTSENSKYFKFMIGLGECFGGLHSSFLFHGDGHIGNFGSIPNDIGKVVTFDYATIQKFLRPLKSAESAFDISLLLPNLDPMSWLFFKAGYITSYGIKAKFTINYIELGGEYKHLVYYENKEYDLALNELFNSLKSTNNETDKNVLFTNIGANYAKKGQLIKGIKYYKKALKGNDFDFITAFNLGVAYFKNKQYQQAIDLLKSLLIPKHIENSEFSQIEPHVYLHISYSYEKIGLYAESILYLDTFLSIAKESNSSFDIKHFIEKRKEMKMKIL